MMARPSAPGWCPSIPAIVNEPWWPGRLIFDRHDFVDSDGMERSRLMALCPYCGKWVPVRGDSLLGHNLPAGSDRSRIEKAEAAQNAYGKIRARELLKESIPA
jgi:hypothetical protein